MQNLRKRNSPCKFKNEPTRFLGEGVSFKAKLIGILEVSEARGDRMCQGALADLKMAIRAAGEHKQRIMVQISIDGLRLRDEKSSDCLYHHPVHKISFIAQDMSDSRAFGYIFGSPDTGHRFFGIKTDKTASQVVIAMRDLFQVVFEIKKKEIEIAKHHIEQQTMNFVEPTPDTKGAADNTNMIRQINSDVEDSSLMNRTKQTEIVADLLGLQCELHSIQQGIHQMDKITPDVSYSTAVIRFKESDPFGDSFISTKVKEYMEPILPPPPSSIKRNVEKQAMLPIGNTIKSSHLTSENEAKIALFTCSKHWFKKDAEDHLDIDKLSHFMRKDVVDNKEKKDANDSSHNVHNQVDVFTELDPLGTGSKKPYVDKKYFFQNLKNPPKKVLKEITISSMETFPTNFSVNKSDENSSIETGSFADASFANFSHLKRDIIVPIQSEDPTIENKLEFSLSREQFLSSEMHLPDFQSISKSNEQNAENPFDVELSTIHFSTDEHSIISPEVKSKSVTNISNNPDLSPRSDNISSTPPPLLHKKLPIEYLNENPTIKDQITDLDAFVIRSKSSLNSKYFEASSTKDIKTSYDNKYSQVLLQPSSIKLKQLTTSFLNDLAAELNVSLTDVTNLTLQELSRYLESNSNIDFKESEVNSNAADVRDILTETFTKDIVEEKLNNIELKHDYDRYAVFRELVELENKELPNHILEETEKPIEMKVQIVSHTLKHNEDKSTNIIELSPSLVVLTSHVQCNSNELPGEKIIAGGICKEMANSEDIHYIEGSSSLEKIKNETDFNFSAKNIKQFTSVSNLTQDCLDKSMEKIDNSDTLMDIGRNHTSLCINLPVDNICIDTVKTPNIAAETICDSKSSDKYAALREIISDVEGPLEKNIIDASGNIPISDEDTEMDLIIMYPDIISATSSEVATRHQESRQDIKASMDILNEVYMFNEQSPASLEDEKQLHFTFDDIFHPVYQTKFEIMEKRNPDNWAVFEPSNLQEEHCNLIHNISPWSPEEKNSHDELPSNDCRYFSSNDIKFEGHEAFSSDNQNNEENYSRRSRFQRMLENKSCYDTVLKFPYAERYLYDNINHELKENTHYIKNNRCQRDTLCWRESENCEKERCRLLRQSILCTGDEKDIIESKSRLSIKSCNGDVNDYRDGHSMCNTELIEQRKVHRQKDSLEKLSSQESVVFEDEVQWLRREYERLKYEEKGICCRERHSDNEHTRRDAIKRGSYPYDYWDTTSRSHNYSKKLEGECKSEKIDNFRTCMNRVKYRTMRPNSVNEGITSEDACSDIRNQFSLPRSSFTQNDSDPYHQSCQPQNRQLYWCSEQEFSTLEEKSHWSERTENIDKSLHHNKKMKHNIRPHVRVSPFEDDFTHNVDCGEKLSETFRDTLQKEFCSNVGKNVVLKECELRTFDIPLSSDYLSDDNLSRNRRGYLNDRVGCSLTNDCIDHRPHLAVSRNIEDNNDLSFNEHLRLTETNFTFQPVLNYHDINLDSSQFKPSKHIREENKIKEDQYVKKSESVNIFHRENDPFDDDDFFK